MVVEDLHHWGQAVGGAGRIAKHMIVCAKNAFVNPKHYGLDVVAFGRSAKAHFFGACLQVELELFFAGEYSGGFNDQVHADFTPGKFRRILYRRYTN
jgi:hypothetical protein